MNFVSKVSISSRITKFINTDCFNQVLNRQWFGHLPGNATESSTAKFKFFLSLISLGLIKHRLRKYRAEDVIDQTSQETVILFLNSIISFHYNLMFVVLVTEK